MPNFGEYRPKPTETPKPKVDWLRDEFPAETRRERMLEGAERLGCFPAMASMLELVAAVDGFRDTAHMSTRVTPGPSDWLQLFQRWQSALASGNLATFTPVAQRLETILDIRNADQHRLYQEDIAHTSLKQLDQAIMAGFRLEDVHIDLGQWDEHYYEPWSSVLLQVNPTSPAEQIRRMDEVTALMEESFKPGGKFHAEADRLNLRRRDGRWLWTNYGTPIGSRQNSFNALMDRAQEYANRIVYGQEQPLVRLSKQSVVAGLPKLPPVVVMTARSWYGDHAIGYGVHTVSPVHLGNLLKQHPIPKTEETVALLNGLGVSPSDQLFTRERTD